MGARRDYQLWNDRDVAELRRRLAQGENYKQIAHAMQRGYHSVAEKAVRLNLGPLILGKATLTRSIREESGLSITAPEETAAESSDDFLARVLKQTGKALSVAECERYVTVRITSETPIAISLSSDWHLSPTGATDVQGLLDYADLTRETPGAYALGVGDLTDNPIKHKPTTVKEIPEEHRLLDIVVGRFGGKLLGTTSGNHDDWLRTAVGLDNLRTLAEKHRLHYAPDELVWCVEIVAPSTEEVTARWVIATRHKYYRHSNLNHTHTCWRWLEDGANNWPSDHDGRTLLPDVLAVGHNHVAAVETRTYDRGDVIACRMGAWQRTSPFTRAGGWTLMPATAPTVILPNVREGVTQPLAFAKYSEAYQCLTMKRAAA